MDGKHGGGIQIKMIFDYIFTIPNMTSGVDDVLVDIVSNPQMAIFTSMFLFFIFCVIFLGGSINQTRRTGSADLPMWASVSSLATLVMALILTLRSGLIQIEVLTTVIGVTLASGLWLFLSKTRNEV